MSIVKEAIINVSFKNILELERLSAFCDSKYIIENYPTRSKIMKLEVKYEPSSNERPVTTPHQQEGFLLNCEGCNKSIQLKVGQLSFHNTDIYMGWDAFLNEFKVIWNNFCETVDKMDLTQIGVRYLNQLELDLPFENGFEDYLKFLPIIPEGINRNLNSFFIQLNIPNEDDSLTGIITETFRIISSNKLHVILDLNAMKQQNVICNSNEMWSSFNDIRNFKNHLFFSCLTEKAIKKYE